MVFFQLWESKFYFKVCSLGFVFYGLGCLLWGVVFLGVGLDLYVVYIQILVKMNWLYSILIIYMRKKMWLVVLGQFFCDFFIFLGDFVGRDIGKGVVF